MYLQNFLTQYLGEDMGLQSPWKTGRVGEMTFYRRERERERKKAHLLGLTK